MHSLSLNTALVADFWCFIKKLQNVFQLKVESWQKFLSTMQNLRLKITHFALFVSKYSPGCRFLVFYKKNCRTCFNWK